MSRSTSPTLRMPSLRESSTVTVSIWMTPATEWPRFSRTAAIS